MGEQDRSDAERISRLVSNPAGYDSENPYADIDLVDLPQWWRKLVEEFRAHDMRPYRPPRFEDGALKHEVVEAIESEFDIDVGFVRYDDSSEQWTVLVNGTAAGHIGHHRAPEGFSVYEMDSAEFETFIRDCIQNTDGESGADDD